jgi:signal transduction histidine kinase
MVIEEVDRINRLLSDLLAFQQPRPPRLETCTVGPVISDCAKLVKPQADKQGVDVVLAGGLAETAIVDKQYFHQILFNLFLNAIEVSQPGKGVKINAIGENGCVVIEASDRGAGLTPEQKEHMFEPFYTTKLTGHGLGLAVSRELAQSMGANLFWRNEASHGTTFILQLKRSNGH